MNRKFELSETQTRDVREYVKKLEAGNNRSDKTIKNKIEALRKLGHHIKKDFKEITEKEMEDYLNSIKNPQSRNQAYANLVLFYRWLLKLRGKNVPDILIDYERAKQKKELNGFEKHVIPPPTFQKLINKTLSYQEKALWETFMLSGARREELQSMKIKHVKILENGKVIISLPVSKTTPREVPLFDTPTYLPRWVGDHPNRDNPESPLWISESSNSKGKQISLTGLNLKLRTALKRANIEKKYTIHDFRRTCASRAFNTRVNGGIKYTDTQFGLLFGWTPTTVAQRRLQYDFTDKKELIELVFGGETKPEEMSYSERETQKVTKIKQQAEKIKELESALKQTQVAVDEWTEIKEKLLKYTE